MVGVSSDCSVAALSGRCPRIALPDGGPPRLQQPLSEPCVRFSLTRLSTRSSPPPLGRWGGCLGDRSPFLGLVSSMSTHQTDLFRHPDLAAGPSLGRGSVVPLPDGGTLPGSDSLSLLLRASEEGLSSSVSDCSCIPRPLRRGVPGGCTSQGFTASVAFAVFSPARLPLVPRFPRGCLTTRQTSRDAADCRVARLPKEDVVSGLRRPDFAGRRRSATRRLGPYRDRTFTGKPLTASLDTPEVCTPAITRNLVRIPPLTPVSLSPPQPPAARRAP